MGSITGTVTDPQAAVVPGAVVVLTHVEANRVSRTTTNATGYFEVNLLTPGTYTVTVDSPGMRKTVRTGLVLNVAGRLEVTIQLQLGQATETVQVTAESPLLDTTSASGGRVIDQRQIVQLPFSDMNPFALATLTAGMQWTGQPEYRRPFDNGGTSSFNTAGGVGSNEYTVDGASVTGTSRRVGFVPSSDAVEEFKLETSSFNATSGFTSGATVNVMTKAGTNSYHGSLYDQHWQQRWNATPHFTRLAFENQVALGLLKPDDQKQATGRSNNFGGSIGGPVRIPKIFNGRDKLFFFFQYNGIYQSKAETTGEINNTVPKMAWRQGDFSDLLDIDPVRFTVYDPRSAQLVNGRVTRTPFPGNKGIPVLNPVYDTYVKFFPAPNDVPGLVSPEGTNNYYASAMPKNEKFNSLTNRVDYNLGERHRVFGRWYWNHRLADEYDWTYETLRGLHSNGLVRINKGGGGDYIWTISNSKILNLSVNLTRFNEGNEASVRTSFKPSDVGLPAYIDAKADQFHMLPQMAVSGVETVGGGYPAIGTRGTTGEARIQMTDVRGSHSLTYGIQERRYWRTSGSPGDSSGVFSFTNTYMRAADNTTTASNTGLAWAAFMMGLPSSISISGNDTAYWSTRYRALFVQDEWRLTRKLKLSLGLRYERGAGSTERFNRGLAAGFDFNYRPVFADAVEAAYAKNPLPEVAASQFKLMGGSQYLGFPSKTFTKGVHTFMPKFGAVYQLDPKTVIRGGYGWYYDVLNVSNGTPSQEGFSQSTGTTVSSDLGRTICCGVGAVGGLSATNNPMVDPFPVRANGTRFETPYGNSLGSMLRQGRGYSFTPYDFEPDFQQRWRIGVQRELRPDVMLDISYNGAFSKIWIAQTINYLPEQYWATGNVRQQAVDDGLNRNVPNPFNISNFSSLAASDPKLYQYLSTSSFFTSSTIRKDVLLRAYPNMNGLTGLRPENSFKDARGNNVYNDLQLLVEKRFSHGLQTSFIYTYATGTDQYYANQFDTELSTRANANLRPHRFVWTTVYELPFGKGRRFVTDSPLQHIVGGWQLSWVYQRQSGPPTDWGNLFYYGDVNEIAGVLNHDEVNSNDIHTWFDPNIRFTGTGAVPSGFVGFEGRSAMQPGSYHVRVFPNRLTSLLQDGIRNWDVKIKRNFRIHEQLRASFDVDLLNATNHTNFAGPNLSPTSTNFGKVTTQRGLSRIIQINLRVDF